jgi:hypothetical protein
MYIITQIKAIWFTKYKYKSILLPLFVKMAGHVVAIMAYFTNI